MRAAIYARYSSDLQREASIEDQVRICTSLARQRGWTVSEIFSDSAISGSTNQRPGFQQMLLAVQDGRIDVVVAEALDRLSRDQEHIAGLYKQLAFNQVKIVTIADGEVTEVHIGLKGTMSALFLKDLGQKTWRGLEGRIGKSKSAGGISFGYDITRGLDEKGRTTSGERVINPVEAEIVVRIFREFAAGRSPRAIAINLNRDGIRPTKSRAKN
ncbi:resolvase, partial [Paramagnetospirillum caucaseum]